MTVPIEQIAMTQMRDTRETREYFDKMLAGAAKRDATDYVTQTENFSPLANGVKSLEPLLYSYTEDWLESLSVMYSRGDSLDEIRSLRIEEGMKRYKYVAGEIEKNKANPYTLFFYSDMGFATQVGSVYTWLSWFICFKADDSFLKEIAPTLANPGGDRLVDTIFARYDPSREIAPGAAYPRSYQLLDDLIDASDDERVSIVNKYLKNWMKFMAATKFQHVLGNYFPRGVKTNKALLETPTNAAYHGYWAWEVALVVVFFSIDDSSFADHPFYPKDLVDYARA